MNENPSRRIQTELTPAEQAKLQRQRELVAAELPELIERDRMRKEAKDEPTLSGALRRAVHASELSLTIIAQRAGITPLVLDEFLTGERTLRSDVLDRLAAVLGREVALVGGAQQP
jgi:hypothetical protein